MMSSEILSLTFLFSTSSYLSLNMEMPTLDLLTPPLPLLLDSQGGEDLSDHVSGQRGVSRCGTDIHFMTVLLFSRM